MFDRKTIDYGRIEWNSGGVYIYSDYNNRRGLLLPCGQVLDARWVGQTVQVKMSNGWTYVYKDFNDNSERYPSK